MQNLEQMEPHKAYPVLASTLNNNEGVDRLSLFAGVDGVLSSALDEVMNSPYPGVSVARRVQSSESILSSDASNPCSNRSDLSMNIVDGGLLHEDMLELGLGFQEEYCKLSTEEESNKHREMTDVDGNSSGHQRNKSEEDGDRDDMLGGVFAFSEEG